MYRDGDQLGELTLGAVIFQSVFFIHVLSVLQAGWPPGVTARFFLHQGAPVYPYHLNSSSLISIDQTAIGIIGHKLTLSIDSPYYFVRPCFMQF